MNQPFLSEAAQRPSGLPEEARRQLTDSFGNRFSTTRAAREHHGRDESAFDPMLPDGVVLAHSTDDVVRVVGICDAWNIPLIAYGSGSSLEGHLLAVHGGVSLDLSEMKAIVALHPDDLTVTVQAGVTREQLNTEIRDSGLFFPIDPGANATLGGMAATRASGTNAVRYGTMRDNVLSLTAVTAQATVLSTGRRARKSSAGYDLTRLFIGSEGTLGIITELTLKLYPLPEAVSAAVCNFPSVDDAVACVIATIQSGVPVARVELMDTAGVRAVNHYSQLQLRESPLLLFEFHGSAASVREQAESVQALAHEYGGMDFDWATRPEDRTRLWAARHNFYFASLQVRPGSRSITTDVCVPISKLAECIRATTDDLARTSIPSTIVGHVGDGNFHVQMLIDPASVSERIEAEAINQRIVERAIALDGTCTGEHGIGLHKMNFMSREHDAGALTMMRQIKTSLDPKNILNPGKMFTLA